MLGTLRGEPDVQPEVQACLLEFRHSAQIKPQIFDNRFERAPQLRRIATVWQIRQSLAAAACPAVGETF